MSTEEDPFQSSFLKKHFHRLYLVSGSKVGILIHLFQLEINTFQVVILSYIFFIHAIPVDGPSCSGAKNVR